MDELTIDVQQILAKVGFLTLQRDQLLENMKKMGERIRHLEERLKKFDLEESTSGPPHGD